MSMLIRTKSHSALKAWCLKCWPRPGASSAPAWRWRGVWPTVLHHIWLDGSTSRYAREAVA